MIKKASLSSLVEMAETLNAEDPGSACAYMAVQVCPGRVPALYRSSPLGFVQSRGFDPDGTRHFVSLGTSTTAYPPRRTASTCWWTAAVWYA